ncbi:MAG: 2-C-methyl-D-erythritol 2,4-cyclodiphosphate synthase [Pseudomonadota bacterium]|nr:2-C-methyl-D-erythritol 2,4-cyclodiphosphate synthase [Pseudomonadota bacterium]
MNLRIGQGYDVHRLAAGESLILGGVAIPHDRGTLAHSDGDVLIHALCDALLGAAALGDIGQHFPDTDPRYRGVSSRVLLREVIVRVHGAGWRVVNVDATLVAQAPKLSPHIPAMRMNLAEDLQVVAERVSIKATTEEGLGVSGAQAGIAAQAVCLLSAA